MQNFKNCASVLSCSEDFSSTNLVQNIEKKALIESLPGPILIIGVSGFIGCNLFRKIFAVRSDVFGTTFSAVSWRLKGIPSFNLRFCNVQEESSVRKLIDTINPRIIFDCSAFGAYSFEKNSLRIHSTNYFGVLHLLESIQEKNVFAYVHAGSSSEYGANAAGPKEYAELKPNSDYAVAKASAALAIQYFGKYRNVPAINLRLYSVYGPYEDSSRLIPNVCIQGLEGKLPVFAKGATSRDFIHIDDVVECFIHSARYISPHIYGESFNVGTGVQTNLFDLACLAKDIFSIQEEPVFDESAARSWDVDNWYANTEQAKKTLNWEAQISLKEGLIATSAWWKEVVKEKDYRLLTKKGSQSKRKNSISAVIACYKDAESIPIMCERLIAVFCKLGVEYEIIFVNDCSPDNSSEIIQSLSKDNPHVLGIVHSRNFGSQAAFRSGMELATKEAIVLLDGDLQDPPELIEEFVEEWRKGADVVYGKRVKREMPFFIEFFYKSFYWIFAKISEIPIPTNAGDFSLIDRSVVRHLLKFKEKDFYLRGLRAYVGFTQASVNYIRPERMFGVSTNNWIKNLGWAKKAIFSFSRKPLHAITAFGFFSFVGTVGLVVWTVLSKILYAENIPRGIPFIIIIILFFGSSTLLCLGILGEYLGKIIEETKSRPQFIRKEIISYGTTKTLFDE